MSIRNLDKLFQPNSVAVIGASTRAGSLGAVVMRNLLRGGFRGPVMPVHPRHHAVEGVLTYSDVADLPETPDLAVICTPPDTVPGLIDELGARGTRAAVVLTAGLNRAGADGKTLQRAMLSAAKPHLLRILGPNCLGLVVPGVGLNASFAHTDILPGRLAFASQSGALCTVVLDWARSHGIGFSHFISMGNSADVDFGDVLDYLGSDPETRAILLYIESVSQARKFMSAARSAARNKPVLAIKAGRVAEGARAASSHTGALAGSDAVFDTALRRAGVLRVATTDELFDAVETLARAKPLKGERLAILTNGGGPGVMATDALIAGGGKLAELAPETLAVLDRVLPGNWSRANPVDVIGDADAARYVAAMTALLDDPGVDALLVMHAPTAIGKIDAIAAEVARIGRDARQNILTCWMGEAGVATARRCFAEAGIASYETPDNAVRAFLHMALHRQSQEMLMQTPPSAPKEFASGKETARPIVDTALAEGRTQLSEAETKAILGAYGIPVVETHVATDPEDAAEKAATIGGPVALKILSPDISHKSDVGGVVLDLETPAEVAQAAQAMRDRVARLKPEARPGGFTVQAMARRPGAHELIVGAATDPVFGPVLLFGRGGTAVEIIADRAVALPPLNMALADELIGRTRIARLLAGYRDRPAADLDAIRLTLLQVAQMTVDLAELVEFDINPLLADDHGVLALDARMRIAKTGQRGPERLAIRPYPAELEEEFTMRSGRTVLLRPIRPEDEPDHHVFISKLSQEDIRFRFFGMLRELPHSEMARLTQIDYDREMAFIARGENADGKEETLGVVRVVTMPDNIRSEFAIVVRSDLKGQGLGRALLVKMVDYCKSRGTRVFAGQILKDNKAMLRLGQSLGMRRVGSFSDVIEVEGSLPDM